jgi:hypothetical protein
VEIGGAVHVIDEAVHVIGGAVHVIDEAVHVICTRAPKAKKVKQRCHGVICIE